MPCGELVSLMLPFKYFQELHLTIVQFHSTLMTLEVLEEDILAWHSEADFPRLVQSIWPNNWDLPGNLVSFRDQAQEWNRNVFGHIQSRKNKVHTRVLDVQWALHPLICYIGESHQRDDAREWSIDVFGTVFVLLLSIEVLNRESLQT